MLERDAEVEDVVVRIEVIRARIDGFRAEQRHELAEAQVHPGVLVEEGQRRVEITVGLDDVGIDDAAIDVLQRAEGVDVTPVAADAGLELEAPVELARLGHQRALDRERGLVEHRLVGAVVEGAAKVLVVVRIVGVAGDAPFHEEAELDARVRLLFDDRILVLGVLLLGGGIIAVRVERGER